MQQEFQIDVFRRLCQQCGRRFEPLEEYVSVLIEPESPPQAAEPAEGVAPESPADEAAAPAAAASEKPTPASAKAAAHGLVRQDFCPPCAPAERSAALAVWRSRVPPPQREKKSRGLVIDDQRLLEVFFRLEGTDDPARLDFRYVIGLMLIRKRKLKMEGTRRRAGGIRVMLVRKPRTKDVRELVDRDLSDEAIIKVSEDIGELLDLVDSEPVETVTQGGTEDDTA